MPQDFTNYLVPYGLLRDLPQYSRQARPVLPASIHKGGDEATFDGYLQQAGRWVGNGEEATYDAQAPRPLSVLAEFLYLHHDANHQPQGYAFPVRPMGLTEADLMPSQGSPAKEAYAKLWQNFDEEYQKAADLCGANPATFTETLVFLLKKYTSCLPAGTSEALRPVALFEYLKLRASLAQCLMRVDQSQENPAFPVLLFCADISGIQDFVYNIVRSKALKGLKGRSFYLQLLLDSLLQQLIDDPAIDLTLAHVVYNSGGKMYLLLPNLKEVRDRLAEIKKELDQQMWDKHKERLAVHMAWLPFRYTEANALEMEGKAEPLKGMGELWEALRRKTGQQKYQAFQGVITAKYEELFVPITEEMDERSMESEEDLDQPKLCAITGDRIIKPNEKDHNLNSEDPQAPKIWVTKTVKAHTKLGYYLKNVIHYNTDLNGPGQGEVAVFTSPNQTRSQFKRAPEVTDEYFRQDPQSLEQVGLPSFRHSRVRYLNDTDFLNKQDVIKKVKETSAFGFSFYGGNEPAFQIDEHGQPIRWEGRNDRFKEKETHQLAGQESDEAKGSGFHRLGVLRMDVDNLGRIFQEGLKENPSLAAYATLSAQLDWFFGGYLNTLREQKQYRDWINILYSGGDDLFLFGRWDRCIEMARDIRAAFKRFLAQRPGLTISGGLAMIEPKFPFSKGAEWAGMAEKEAKKGGKDAFHLLGQTVRWGKELDMVQKERENMSHFFQKGWLTKGFIYRLYALKRIKDRGHHDWIWLVVYTFSQFARQARRGELEEYLNEMKNNIFTSRWASGDPHQQAEQLFEAGRLLDLYALAANLTELTERQARQDKKA